MSDIIQISSTHWQPYLGKSLAKMLQWGRLCDVTIKVEDGNDLLAHGCILAAASPYITQLLKVEEKLEEKIKEIKVPGIAFITWTIILDYIYTGEALLPDQYFKQTLAAAKMLELPLFVKDLMVQHAAVKAAPSVATKDDNSGKAHGANDKSTVPVDKPHPPKTQGVRRSILLSNIPHVDFNEVYLKMHFSKYGTVLDVQLNTTNKTAKITFSKEDDAARALKKGGFAKCHLKVINSEDQPSDKKESTRSSNQKESSRSTAQTKANPPVSAPTTANRKKCSFFLEGRCNKGNSCSFLHAEEAPNNSGATPCFRMVKYGACVNGSSCRFSHDVTASAAASKNTGKDDVMSIEERQKNVQQINAINASIASLQSGGLAGSSVEQRNRIETLHVQVKKLLQQLNDDDRERQKRGMKKLNWEVKQQGLLGVAPQNKVARSDIPSLLDDIPPRLPPAQKAPPVDSKSGIQLLLGISKALSNIHDDKAGGPAVRGPSPRYCVIEKWAHFNGFGFTLQDNTHLVTSVSAGSPAEATGLRANDTVLAINGSPIQHDTPDMVVDKIKRSRDRIAFLVADAATLEYYRSRNIPITQNLPEVTRIVTPAPPVMPDYRDGHHGSGRGRFP